MASRFLRFAPLLLLSCSSASGEPAPAPPQQTAPLAPAVHFVSGDADVTKTFFAERVAVRITGAAPGARVSVHATMGAYASHATFTADASGTVDAAAQAPVEGSYDGVDPDGLFWSMLRDADQEASSALDVEVSAESDGKELARATLERVAEAPDLQEVPVSDDGLVGVFVTPGEPGPHPTLLTFGGSEGGLSSGKSLAHYWASQGYACLGLAYFAEASLPASLAEIPLEYFEKAIAWVKKQPKADASRLGVIGGSRGGELALLLGATFPEVKAVVAQVPSGVSWSGFSGFKETASWTWRGQNLPYVPNTTVEPKTEKTPDGRTLVYYTNTFDASLDGASPAALDAASFKVEGSNAAMLLLAGASDALWPSCRLAKIAMDRLQSSGHAAQHPDDMQCYPGAGHSIGAPGLPTTGPTAVKHPQSGEWIELGGTPAGIAHASRDAFERKKTFLAKVLGKR